MKQVLLCVLLAVGFRCAASNYRNFDVAIYIPASVVHSFEDPSKLQNDWNVISNQLKVDKVYIESQRDHLTNSDALLDRVKQFFLDRGVRVAGGMALSDGGNGGQFQSFCYTDPNDRAFIKSASELAARHFDEFIQDDFFFTSTKYESDIRAKRRKSWTQFRLQLMDAAAENLIIKPARAVNPRVRLIIKFPNWYEHYQGNGYDLDKESKLFSGIYTGTETRDPVITDQHLQEYQSYEIMRYLDNVAPGRNGGGWVDTYSVRWLDRYAEQLWDTMFAKAPQIMLFEWSALTRPIDPGDRDAWEDLHTSFDYGQMLSTFRPGDTALAAPTVALVAGYSLEQVDSFLGKLGNPIGIAAYKPYQSTGEDYLHNYLGMIGIPIELQPGFPTNADLVLLTESAKFDPDIVPKIRNQLRAGKSVVITSGLLRALQGRGIEDIIEARCTDRRVLARDFSSGFGAGNASALAAATNAGILLPEIDFITNDAWSLVRAEANGNAFPLLLMDRYSKGVLYILTVPDNFNDLYALPPMVTSAIKNYLMSEFPVRLDGPARVALFAYDNHTFIVESYLDTPTDVTVSVIGNTTRLKNLVTGEQIDGQFAFTSRWRRNAGYEKRVSFQVHLLPHSYEVFEMGGKSNLTRGQ
ncbi:MAG TPA: hypothetical protein VMF08_01045 [Candidatus Sulfotelmatobacter sp.]|nr:hypothetical protein [Candidatus Sulfotelmatobacter sp.]